MKTVITEMRESAIRMISKGFGRSGVPPISKKLDSKDLGSPLIMF
jgi:hypothetical protein